MVFSLTLLKEQDFARLQEIKASALLDNQYQSAFGYALADYQRLNRGPQWSEPHVVEVLNPYRRWDGRRELDVDPPE